jgi:hypothetical protein
MNTKLQENSIQEDVRRHKALSCTEGHHKQRILYSNHSNHSVVAKIADADGMRKKIIALHCLEVHRTAPATAIMGMNCLYQQP